MTMNERQETKRWLVSRTRGEDDGASFIRHVKGSSSFCSPEGQGSHSISASCFSYCIQYVSSKEHVLDDERAPSLTWPMYAYSFWTRLVLKKYKSCRMIVLEFLWTPFTHVLSSCTFYTGKWFFWEKRVKVTARMHFFISASLLLYFLYILPGAEPVYSFPWGCVLAKHSSNLEYKGRMSISALIDMQCVRQEG